MVRSLGLLVVSILCLCGVALAAVVELLELEQLVAMSDRVVVATVVDQRVHAVDQGRRIVTDHVVQIEETFKGEPAQTLVVRTPGGVIGDIGQRVEGAAQLQLRQRMLLLLQRDQARRGSDSAYLVVGLAQGAFELRRHANGQEIAVAQLRGMSARAPNGQLFQVSGAPAMRWPELRARLRELCGDPKRSR